MKIAVLSRITSLACEAGKALEEELGCQVSLTSFDSHLPQLRVAESVSMDQVRSILSVIAPFSPPLVRDAALDARGMDAELVLTNDRPRHTSTVEILTLSETTGEQLAQLVESLTENNVQSKSRWSDKDEVAFGRGVDQFTRDTVLFALKRQGLNVKASPARLAKNKIKIQVQNRDQLDVRKMLRIELRCDDSHLAEQLEQTGLAGFSVVRGPATAGSHFSLMQGALGSRDFIAASDEVVKEVSRLLSAQGVDQRYFPLVVNRRATPAMTAVLHLPIEEMRSGKLRRYAGDVPDRIHIKIRSDDNERVLPLRDLLVEAGYSTELLRISGMSQDSGFTLNWGEAKDCPEQQTIIKSLVQSFLPQVTSPEYELTIGKRESDKSPIPLMTRSRKGTVVKEVVITLPIKAAEAGLVPSGVARGLDFKAEAPEIAHWAGVLEPFKLLGFDQFVTGKGHSRTEKTALLRYGGASLSLVQRIVEAVRETGIDVETQKAWSNSDDDLWLDLPDHPDYVKTRTTQSEVAVRHETAPLTPAADEQIYPAIESDGSRVVFYNYLGARFDLQRRTDVSPQHPLLKEALDHSDMCMDQGALATLNHVAYSVRLAQPVLLEGETATSKTSTILHLAGLLNQPVRRLNLNSQSDVSELIGRYVQTSSGQWAWQDGVILACMRRGEWAIIDEGNLAVGACLERLNSVLERSPSLIISEHNNEAVPISPHFRIFFTMNPATYTGRNVLSPAWRDRFSGYRYCLLPGEHEFLQMLNYLVFGEQPAIRYHDRWIKADDLLSPPFIFLQNFPGIRDWLSRLARLHCSLQSMVNTEAGGTLAHRQKEKPVFSRRVLFEVLNEVQLASGNLADQPMEVSYIFYKVVERYYAGRFSAQDDRENVKNLIHAVGFAEARRQTKVVPLFAKRRKPGAPM